MKDLSHYLIIYINKKNKNAAWQTTVSATLIGGIISQQKFLQNSHAINF